MKKHDLLTAMVGALLLSTIPGVASADKGGNKKGGSDADVVFNTSQSKDAQGRKIEEGYFLGADGKPVRYKLYEHKGGDAGLVVFLNGRGEFIEKYEALFSASHQYPNGPAPASETLSDLPFDYATLDFEGQGKSIEGRLPGDLASYDNLVQDVDTLVRIASKRLHNDDKVVLFGHSMGGLVATRYAETYPDKVGALVLSSPLLQIAAPPGVPEGALEQLAYAYALPQPNGFGLADRCAVPQQVPTATLGALAMCLSNATCATCFADPSGAICPFLGVNYGELYGAYGFLQSPASIGCPSLHSAQAECTLGSPYFNGLTTDYSYCSYFVSSPLAIGGPTFGWLMQTVETTAAARQSLAAITQPVLMLVSPIDPVVVPATNIEACGTLSSCTLKTYAPSQSGFYLHELLAETNRAAPIADVRAFLSANAGKHGKSCKLADAAATLGDAA